MAFMISCISWLYMAYDSVCLTGEILNWTTFKMVFYHLHSWLGFFWPHPYSHPWQRGEPLQYCMSCELIRRFIWDIHLSHLIYRFMCIVALAATVLLGWLELGYLFGHLPQLGVVVRSIFGPLQYVACEWGHLYTMFCF